MSKPTSDQSIVHRVIAALFVDPSGVYSTFNDGKRKIDPPMVTID